ncbi:MULTISPECIES: hypothetical protein [unclassified Microcoleus]
MPVPQENSVFVEQASCLFLIRVQNVRYYPFTLPNFQLPIANLLPQI